MSTTHDDMASTIENQDAKIERLRAERDEWRSKHQAALADREAALDADAHQRGVAEGRVDVVGELTTQAACWAHEGDEPGTGDVGAVLRAVITEARKRGRAAERKDTMVHMVASAEAYAAKGYTHPAAASEPAGWVMTAVTRKLADQAARIAGLEGLLLEAADSIERTADAIETRKVAREWPIFESVVKHDRRKAGALRIAAEGGDHVQAEDGPPDGPSGATA